MGGVIETKITIPNAGCIHFLNALRADGFCLRDPFELQDSEAAVLLAHDAMGDTSFILDFSQVSAPTTNRFMTLHWWSLRGPKGRKRAEQIVQRILNAAEAHGGTLIREAIPK